MKLRLIGYWSGGHSRNSEWPDPADLVDLSWDEEERTDVGYYLQHGLYARGFMGYSPCRLCSKVDNGNAELTDGTYIWPQGLAHYVRDHSVRLPALFIEHVRDREAAMDDIDVDPSWWRGITTAPDGR